MTTKKSRNSIIKKRSFNEKQTIVITGNQEVDIQEEKHMSIKDQNMTFDPDAQRTQDQEESKRLIMTLNDRDRKKLQIERIVPQR